MSPRVENEPRTTTEASDLSSSVVKERRAILQRVLWSRHLEKYSRIRELLIYVCERALNEPSVEIHEQEIGHNVFNRAEEYDTSADNIVRVTASQARKKLAKYFDSEGSSEPIILEIPTGQYKPVFRKRELPDPVLVPESPEQRLNRSLVRYRRAVIILAFASLALCTLLIWGGMKLRTARLAAPPSLNSMPTLHSLWSQLLPSDGRTDIVVSDSSLSLFEELLDHQLALAEYLKPGQWPLPRDVAADARLKAFAALAAQRGFTSMASVMTASRISQLVGVDHNRVSILRARDFNMTQMKFDNVILLGSSRANPWEYLLEDRLNFRFGYDQKTRYSYFENRNPRSGELQFYRTDSNISYCRIAFLPNLAGTGNILAIAGTEIEGTEGGGEFVTSERSLSKLMSLPGFGYGKPMPHFEILLKSNRVAGQTEGLSIVAFRIVHP
jgi:hypothetical protein